MLYQPSRVYALRNNVQGFIYDPGDTPNVSFALISK
jgi:peptide/nickel transport system substrate-binding protein